jgi:hypothetical protein
MVEQHYTVHSRLHQKPVLTPYHLPSTLIQSHKNSKLCLSYVLQRNDPVTSVSSSLLHTVEQCVVIWFLLSGGVKRTEITGGCYNVVKSTRHRAKCTRGMVKVKIKLSLCLNEHHTMNLY